MRDIIQVALIGLLLSTAALSDNKSGAQTPAKAATAPAATVKSFDGWVSDERCGANINAECSRKCQAMGAKLVFVSLDKTVVPVSNDKVLTAYTGQRVKVQGKMDKGVLTVVSVKAVAE